MRQKMAYFRRFWVEELRHSETLFAKKRYTLIPLQRISDDFGLRSPVIQKTFQTKSAKPLS